MRTDDGTGPVEVWREARALAEEYGTTVATMEAFLRRFAPRWTRADQFRAESDVMLFVHIPKTAGMSLGASLSGAFDKFRGVKWTDIPTSFRYHMRHALYLQTQVPVRQVMMGHFGWTELQYWRSHELPLKCGTLLRDPLARAVSNYRYNRSEAHPEHAAFRARFPDLESYAKRMLTDVQLTQAIGMFDSFDRALERLTAHYTFLGVTERMAAALRHLERTHGLPPLAEARSNVAPPAPEEPVSDEVAEIVAIKSHNDAKLHSLLCTLYDAA